MLTGSGSTACIEYVYIHRESQLNQMLCVDICVCLSGC